jgi:hypothetical protein
MSQQLISILIPRRKSFLARRAPISQTGKLLQFYFVKETAFTSQNQKVNFFPRTISTSGKTMSSGTLKAFTSQKRASSASRNLAASNPQIR